MMFSRTMIACVAIAVAVGVFAFRKDEKEIRRLTSLTGDALKEAVDLKLKAKPSPFGNMGAEMGKAVADTETVKAADPPELEAAAPADGEAAAAPPEAAAEEGAAAVDPPVAEADGENADENADDAAQPEAPAEVQADEAAAAPEPEAVEENQQPAEAAAAAAPQAEAPTDEAGAAAAPEAKLESPFGKKDTSLKGIAKTDESTEDPTAVAKGSGDWATDAGHTNEVKKVEAKDRVVHTPMKGKNTDSEKDKSLKDVAQKEDTSEETPAPIKQRGDWVKAKEAEAKSGGVRSAVSATLLVLALALVMQ